MRENGVKGQGEVYAMPRQSGAFPGVFRR